MESSKMPQMRVLVTDFCDSKCIYCRPTGEGNLECTDKRYLSYEVAKKAAEIYKRNGGTEIKISGGDPVFWPYLVEYVRYLKMVLKFDRVEVITRSIKIKSIIDELITAGLDVLNFSLDTISETQYKRITGKKDFSILTKIIRDCACKIYCKINMVVMKNVNPNDWIDMIAFCEDVGIKQLKLLDYIDDLQGSINAPQSQTQLYLPFDKICDELRARYGSESIIYQGGLGHPMNEFTTNLGLKIICKNSQNGAWYCEECMGCTNYPCHDALMALRVTPSNSFQLCLINSEKHWFFDDSTIDKQFSEILSLYQNAFFVGDGDDE